MTLFPNRGTRMVFALTASVLGLSVISAATGAQTASGPALARPPSAVSDAALAARVKAALHADPNFYDIHVEVSMEDSAVVLSGLVQNNREMFEGIRAASQAAPGRKIINHMEIEKTSPR